VFLSQVNPFAAVATVHFLRQVLAYIAQRHEYAAKAVDGRGRIASWGLKRKARPVKSRVIKSLT
jgi:hypothetical protein